MARRASGALSHGGSFWVVWNQMPETEFNTIRCGGAAYWLRSRRGVLDRKRLYIRAFELASSGQHIDCITIVSALAAEGFTDAAEALADERLRSQLRTICQQHWRPDRARRATGHTAPIHPDRE